MAFLNEEHHMTIFAIALTALLFQSPAQAAKPVKVLLKNSAGESVGDAVLTDRAGGVAIALHLKGLTPGEHAPHFHENPKCDGPDFKSAGGHFATAHKMHGQVEGGPHEGDLPNIVVAADGTSKTNLMADHVTLKKGPNSLLKGSAMVIHAKSDDYKSQPAGNAGDRVACGVIK
jgi:Cu-Zn family superoxide dismutase